MISGSKVAVCLHLSSLWLNWSYASNSSHKGGIVYALSFR